VRLAAEALQQARGHRDRMRQLRDRLHRTACEHGMHLLADRLLRQAEAEVRRCEERLLASGGAE